MKIFLVYSLVSIIIQHWNKKIDGQMSVQVLRSGPPKLQNCCHVNWLSLCQMDKKLGQRNLFRTKFTVHFPIFLPKTVRWLACVRSIRCPDDHSRQKKHKILFSFRIYRTGFGNQVRVTGQTSKPFTFESQNGMRISLESRKLCRSRRIRWYFSEFTICNNVCKREQLNIQYS